MRERQGLGRRAGLLERSNRCCARRTRRGHGRLCCGKGGVRLSSYMAMSACCNSVPGSVAYSSEVTTPMLACTITCRSAEDAGRRRQDGPFTLLAAGICFSRLDRPRKPIVVDGYRATAIHLDARMAEQPADVGGSEDGAAARPPTPGEVLP